MHVPTKPFDPRVGGKVDRAVPVGGEEAAVVARVAQAELHPCPRAQTVHAHDQFAIGEALRGKWFESHAAEEFTRPSAVQGRVRVGRAPQAHG